MTPLQTIPVSTIAGEPASLADHAGQVLLVVNVASKCGLTPQYTALESLFESRRDQGFAVLGFPANNFGAQEPGTEAEIVEFCTTNFGVKFPMFSKISVTGEDQHPLYRELTSSAPQAEGDKESFRARLRGFGMTPTEGLAALRAYEPSHEAMRQLLKNFFAVNPDLITEELVKIRYEASVADGAYEAYRAMFFDPKHKGSELAITAEEVRTIATPTLLIHGREDKVVPLAVSITMLDLLPNADLHVFSRCGHWTQIERADEFSALVATYLERS